MEPIKPLVTVIIATFNSSKTLKFTLGSLLNQDFTDFEAWVVGDACTDDSQEVVDSFGDKRLHWTNLPHNSGSQATPNNEGLRRASGRYIAYLGHDDLWFPCHLSGLVSFIKETGADLVHSLCPAIGPSKTMWIGPPRDGRTYANHHVPPSSWLHRREIIEDCGLWGDHTKLSWGVDYDYLRRIYLAGKRIEFCPQFSLLKFPSPWWGTYAKTSDYPQESYLPALKDDPEELQRKVLLESAISWTRQAETDLALAPAFRNALVAFRRWLVKIYGRDRWPLPSISRWKFQRDRRQIRRLRGLPVGK